MSADSTQFTLLLYHTHLTKKSLNILTSIFHFLLVYQRVTTSSLYDRPIYAYCHHVPMLHVGIAGFVF